MCVLLCTFLLIGCNFEGAICKEKARGSKDGAVWVRVIVSSPFSPVSSSLRRLPARGPERNSGRRVGSPTPAQNSEAQTQ